MPAVAATVGVALPGIRSNERRIRLIGIDPQPVIANRNWCIRASPDLLGSNVRKRDPFRAVPILESTHDAATLIGVTFNHLSDHPRLVAALTA